MGLPLDALDLHAHCVGGAHVFVQERKAHTLAITDKELEPAHINIYTYVYRYMYMHVYAYIYIHIYIYIFIFIYYIYVYV